MTVRPLQDTTAAPTALTAFLRGVERRGAVFAHLLAGSQAAGDTALAATVEAFRAQAGRTAFGDWPRRFWSQLLATPSLRQPPAAPAWAPEFAWLGQLGHGPRAALLLRVVAGLAESDAAAVLGVARGTYRLGLQRALPHNADGSADLAAWQALGAAAQDMLRGLPPERLAQLAHVREEAIAGSGTPPSRRQRVVDPVPARRGQRAALWAIALLTLAALAATFLPGVGGRGAAGDAPDGIMVEPLPAAEAPAARYPDEAALALHPDLALLLDAGIAGAEVSDPAFHAWYAAQQAAGREASPPTSAAARGGATVGVAVDPRGRSETDDASL